MEKLTGTRLYQVNHKTSVGNRLTQRSQSYVVPLPSTHRCSSVVQEDQSSYSVFTPRIPTHSTESLHFALHEVLLSANLLCTVTISLQKHSKNRHMELYLFVFLLCIWKVWVLNLGLKNVAGIRVRLLLFFLLHRQILCQYIQFIRFVYLFNDAVSRPVYCLLVLLVYEAQ